MWTAYAAASDGKVIYETRGSSRKSLCHPVQLYMQYSWLLVTHRFCTCTSDIFTHP